LLAKDGVDPGFKDNHGCTPLSWAAATGYEAIVKLLLAKDGVVGRILLLHAFDIAYAHYRDSK
jgi:ankyrin repeat protein